MTDTGEGLCADISARDEVDIDAKRRVKVLSAIVDSSKVPYQLLAGVIAEQWDAIILLEERLERLERLSRDGK